MTTLQAGDWVTTTTIIAVTLADSLTNSGLPTGTPGVVTGTVGWSRVTVDFNAGFGITTATVPTRSLRRTRPGGGIDAFHTRTSRRVPIRIGAALALALPGIWFVTQYLWTYHTLDGILPATAIGIVEGAGDLLEMAITHPVQTLIYLAAATLTHRIAYGPTRRNKHRN